MSDTPANPTADAKNYGASTDRPSDPPRDGADEAEAIGPLRAATSEAWARQALADPLALLNDHAHLEKKAASNALDLVHRYPDAPANVDAEQHASYRERWVKTLAVIAREESEHLALVVRILQRRGGELSRQHRNAYAADLRGHVRMGEGPAELLDRLMVSALIEVRSCERFSALAAHCEDAELAGLYRGLHASEWGHYLIFHELACGVLPAAEVDAAWDRWLDVEAAVLAKQPPGCRIHSGDPIT